MPSSLALLLTLAFILFLYRREISNAPYSSSALWLPFLWVTISGSRFVTEWLALLHINLGGSSIEEGSPIDAIFFFVIIALGIRVLLVRHVSLRAFIVQNQWVAIYLAYCLVSCVWSEYPFVAFKRWIKIIGQPVMVLIVLTEPNPLQSLISVIKRSAIVLIPLSVTFIKYFPEIGRGFDAWSGAPTNTGVTTNKNTLGVYCMVVGLVFFWHLLNVLKRPAGVAKRNELIFIAIFSCMLLWTAKMAQSATSLATLGLGIGIMLILGRPFVNRRKVGTYFMIVIPILLILHFGVGATDMVYELLGRNSTLTGRTEIWEALLNNNNSPILGYGFESFWLGDRRSAFSQTYVFELNSAHNGYLETYLNLGIVGLIITVAMVFSAYFKSQHELLRNFEFGRFRIAFLIAFLIYNWTEAAFRTHIVPFYLFFVVAMDYMPVNSSNRNSMTNGMSSP